MLNVIAGSKNKLEQIKNYGILSSELASNNLNKAELYIQQGIKLCEIELQYKSTTAANRNKLLAIQSEILNDYGYFLKNNSNYDKAIIYYKKSITAQKHRTDTIDESAIATSLVNIGNVYNYIEDIPNALEHFFEGAKIYDRIKDEEGIAFAYKSIASIYEKNGNLNKAQIYIDKVVEKLKKLDIKIAVAFSLITQSRVYNKQGKNKIALSQLKEALVLFEQLQKNDGVLQANIEIGKVFESENKLDSALYFYRKVIQNIDNNNDKLSMINGNYHIAFVLYKKNESKLALNSAKVSYALAKEIGLLDKIQDNAKLLGNIYSKLGNFREAFEMQKEYELIHDSLNKTENDKKIIQKQFQFEYDKKAVADSIKTTQQKQILEIQIAKQKSQNNYLFGTIFLIALFTFFVYNRLQITRKQKNIISEQKAIVDEKQKEIVDSITYAKRIQQAILPSKTVIDQSLKNYFVLYKPKDIVAGDFYWLTESQNKTDDKIYVAVCDCTGHGVPGAMVSVICNNALNQAVIEFGETVPGKIFDKARTYVLENFAKSDEIVNDGMDASLAKIDFKNKIMWWSGANNPLWIIRKTDGASNKNAFNLIEIKPDKQPIGKGYETKPFTTHEIELQKNDTIYLLTDGFADQFGGEKNKKMTKAKFKQFLLQTSHLSMNEQHLALSDFYEKYKGNEEQIDDVCVVGIRV